jgi:hypothetical protein
MVDVKKEYMVALKGSSYTKNVTAKDVADAKTMVYGLLKKQYPAKAVNVNPDRDLVARLIRVYKDDKLVGQWKKSQNMFVGRRG